MTLRGNMRRLGAIPLSGRLDWLATWYGTDKGPRAHGYTTHYQTHLAARRKEQLNVLEIGVGGQNTNSGGASLRMWRSFFPRASIVGVDLYRKQLPAENRITVLQGDQADGAFLDALVTKHGPFDLIVDDGSHRGDHITATFSALWHRLRPGGVYVIEDLETAYDPAYGGGDPGMPGTALALVKAMLDEVQLGPQGVSVHVYRGIVFLIHA